MTPENAPAPAPECHRSTRQRRSAVHGEEGQALVETAVTLTLFVLLMLGILEFGRAFMISNVIADAARVGARAASLEPAANRNDLGFIVSTSEIVNDTRSRIAASVGNDVAEALAIAVVQTAGTPPLVEVSVTGEVPFLFRFIGNSFDINRTVAFRDPSR